MEFKKLETRKDLAQATAKGVCLIDFSAPWCGPCKAQEPIVRQIAADFDGRARIAQLNVSEHRQMAAQFGIYSIPTLILYKNGREVRRFVGMQPREVLAGAIEGAVGKGG